MNISAVGDWLAKGEQPFGLVFHDTEDMPKLSRVSCSAEMALPILAKMTEIVLGRYAPGKLNPQAMIERSQLVKALTHLRIAANYCK